MKNIKYDKVIIWGYPLYSHTHSYVHHSYYKAFKHLGYDVYWFHDGDYPIDFDYNNSLFIGEGFADKNIPINSTSCYFIMYCPSPIKYSGAERFIDVRTSGNLKDHIYDYNMEEEDTVKIGPGCFFSEKKQNKVHVKNDYVDYTIDDYDKIYISWATDLLPDEINFDDADIKRENFIQYSGTIGTSGKFESISNFEPFLSACRDNNIPFYHNCPWTNPLSFDELMKMTKKSLLGIDIRGKEHVKMNVITCRVFKNISYGHLGLTNSKAIYEIMDGNCVYNPDTEQLFYDGIRHKDDKKMIVDGMRYVKENHTYINRINSILSII